MGKPSQSKPKALTAPPRGRLRCSRKVCHHHPKPSPWTDSPRSGRDVALATEWGAGGCERSEQTEGVCRKNPLSHRCAMPAPPRGELLYLFRSAVIKLPLRGKTSPAPGEDVTAGDKRGNLDATNGSGLRGFRREQHPFRQNLRLCHLPQGDGFSLWRQTFRHCQKAPPWGSWRAQRD